MRNVVAKAVEGNNGEEMGDGESLKGSSWQTLPAGTEEIVEHLVSSLFGMALCDFRAKILFMLNDRVFNLILAN